LGSLGYGTLFFRFIPQQHLLFSFGLGIWILGHLVYAAGLFGHLITVILWGLIIAGNMLFVLEIFSTRRRKLAQEFLKEIIPRDSLATIGCLALLLLLIFALSGALSPPVQKDSLAYHLVLPDLYLQAGQWYEIPQNIYSYFPGFVEALYTLALGAGSNSPALIHFVFGVACLGATARLGKLLGLKRHIILLSLIGLFATPTFWSEMTWAYVDLASTFFTLCAIISFFYWQQERRKTWLVTLGFFMGAAFCCKYTSLVLFAVAPFAILLELKKDRESDLQRIIFSLAIPLIIGGLVSSPWWLRNVILTGNPFFPIFWDLFPTHGFRWDFERTNLYNIFLTRYGGIEKGFWDYVLAPIKVFLFARINEPELYDGKLGFYYLLAFPTVLFWKKLPSGIHYLLGFIAIYMIYWSTTSQQARFLLVVLPVLTLLMGYCLQEATVLFPGGKTIKPILFSGLLITVMMNVYDISSVVKHEKYLDYSLGQISKEDYLKSKLNYYGMYQYINENLPNDSYLFLVMTGNQGFYLERPYFSDSVFEGHTLKRILNNSESTYEVLEYLRQRGWSHLLIRPDFFAKDIVQSNNKLQEHFVDLLNKKLELLKISGPYWLLKIP
jgi:hypothetical protein